MRVLYIVNNLTKGGAERFVLDLVTCLKNDYPEVKFKLAVLDDTNHYAEYKDIEVVNLDYKPYTFRGVNVNPRLEDVIADFEPDIIHSNLFLSEFLTSLIVHPDIKYVCHGHDNMHQFSPLSFFDFFSKRKVMNRIDYYLLAFKKYKKADTFFIANSSHTYSFYKRNVPRKQQQNVRLIQYGFSYSKFFQEKNNSFHEKKVRLLNIGSYQPKKNQIFAVKIAEELKNRGVDFELNLIGDGMEFETVRNEIIALNLKDYVFQRGMQSNVECWYQNSDIYLHTAYYEPFGLVFLEAMASGLPVITLDGKGNRDIIENEKNGYLIENQDVQKFADSIVELLSNKEKYIEMSKYAQVYAKKFDVKIKTKELVEFYQSILD